MLKQRPQPMTAMTVDDIKRELTDVRTSVEELRRQSKKLCGRTSQLYVQIEHLKKTSKGNGR